MDCAYGVRNIKETSKTFSLYIQNFAYRNAETMKYPSKDSNETEH